MVWEDGRNIWNVVWRKAVINFMVENPNKHYSEALEHQNYLD